MSNFSKREFIPNSVYYIMTEHPNCCPKCSTRLAVIETLMIEDEKVQVNYCERCGQEILMVEDDVAFWPV